MSKAGDTAGDDGKALFCFMCQKTLQCGVYEKLSSIVSNLDASFSTPELTDQSQALVAIIEDFASQSEQKQIVTLVHRLRGTDKATLAQALDILFGEATRSNLMEMLLVSTHLCLALAHRALLTSTQGDSVNDVIVQTVLQGADSMASGLSGAVMDAGGWAKVIETAAAEGVDLFTMDAILGSASLRIGQEVSHD